MNWKFIVIALATVFLALVLAGCQSKNDNEWLMVDVSDIREISISKSTNLGKLNGEFFATFEQESKELETLKHVLTTAKREPMKLEDVNYDLLVTDNERGYYLLQCYLGDEGEQSAFYYIGHEDKVYYTSEETTQQLRQVIKP